MSKVNKRVMNLKYNKRARILAAVAVIICVSSLIVLALKSDKYVYINELQRPEDNEGARKYDIELVVDESVDNVTVYVKPKKGRSRSLMRFLLRHKKACVWLFWERIRSLTA